jgi:molybdopterin molybdotransferase
MDIRTRGFQKRTTVEDARRVVLGHAVPMVEEDLPLERVLGRVLATDIRASQNIPPFDRAAMDGYAVRAESTFGATQTNPIMFTIAGEVAMGVPIDTEVGDFEAVKIMTGGPMPSGADSVVMFEYTRDQGERIEVTKPVTPGKNVGLKGEDIRKGEMVLEHGRVLRSQDAGILAALGIKEVQVSEQPRVAIISTGDELVEPGGELGPGKIYNANTYSLSSKVRVYGGVPHRFELVRDDYDKIKEAIQVALEYDVVILSGATSVGKKDVIPEIVQELGEVHFHGVAMRPGEPTGFGTIQEKPVFMLPGYPVAALVGFDVFAGPAIQVAQGAEPKSPYPVVKAILKRKIASELGRMDFPRVKVVDEGGMQSVEPIRTSGSGIISSLVKADGYVIVPENTEGLEKGKEVEVHLY